MHCARCEGFIEGAFRYCPWCAAPQRAKIVEWFEGDPKIESGPSFLRISRYLTEHRHVRVSIWREGQAVATMSLGEAEAARLHAFLGTPDAPRSARPLRRHVTASARALLDEVGPAMRCR